MGEGGLFFHPLPESLVVNNVVAANQTGQVKCLGGGIERYGSAAGILADALGGDVSVIVKYDVGPDFI